jgi:hypothetical protein
MPDRTNPKTAWAAAAVMTAAGLLSSVPAEAASAATTTSCVSGSSNNRAGLHFPTPVVNLGTSCTGFSDAGSPYVFTIAYLNVATNQLPYNVTFSNVTATCGSYSYSGTSLIASGCTYLFGGSGR